jgi:acyl-CoA synthetase (AMP-forming)/AMP-acid ligase II
VEAFHQTSKAATLVDLLRGRALADPARQAYTFLTDGEMQEVHLTCGELDQRARAIGASLQAAGAKGERVLLLYPPSRSTVMREIRRKRLPCYRARRTLRFSEEHITKYLERVEQGVK